MKPALTYSGFLLWLPRIITILFTIFLSLFAMDVFREGKSFIETLAELLIHLIPSFLLIILLLLSWNREWIGALFFLMLGIARLIITNFRFGIMTELLIAGPLFLISMLYLFNWIRHYRNKSVKGTNG